MPQVKITTGVVCVELAATEASVDELGRQAISLLQQALNAGPAPREVGYGAQHIERRDTADVERRHPTQGNPDVNV